MEQGSAAEPVAAIGLDPGGRISSWSADAERLVGWRAEDVVGEHVAVLYADEHRSAGLPGAILAAAAEDGRAEAGAWLVHGDGSRHWADVVVSAVRDGRGDLVGFAKLARDRTGDHDLAEELRRSEERFRLLVSQVVDYAIITLDPHGFIESWNAGAEALKGWSEAEAVGRHLSIFYSEADREAGLPERLLAQAREHGRVAHQGWRVRRDGTRFWGDVVLTVLHDDAGEVVGFAKVTRDRTVEHDAEEAQARIVSALSHDLRTPIAAIRGFAQVVDRAADDAQRALMLERIVANADRLLTMIDDLLVRARDRSLVSRLRPEAVDLRTTVEAALDVLSLRLTGRPVEVVGADLVVRADPVALARIVVNLVDNAVRYSDDGTGIEIELVAAARPTLVVRDHGRGIHPDDLDTIFDEFARGRLARSGDGGTGLGLASVRDLVHAQGGAVAIASELDVGTTVTITLDPPD